MGFRDVWAECESCGRRYVFSVEMQREIEATGKGNEMATLCPNCYHRKGEQVSEPSMPLDPVTGHWIGLIKWLDLEKGYGFIDRGDGTDIFVHKSEVIGNVIEMVQGQQVTYDVEETLKGPQAVEVRIFAPPSS